MLKQRTAGVGIAVLCGAGLATYLVVQLVGPSPPALGNVIAAEVWFRPRDPGESDPLTMHLNDAETARLLNDAFRNADFEWEHHSSTPPPIALATTRRILLVFDNDSAIGLIAARHRDNNWQTILESGAQPVADDDPPSFDWYGTIRHWSCNADAAELDAQFDAIINNAVNYRPASGTGADSQSN